MSTVYMQISSGKHSGATASRFQVSWAGNALGRWSYTQALDPIIKGEAKKRVSQAKAALGAVL